MSKEKQLRVISLLVLMVGAVCILEVNAASPDTTVRIEPTHLAVSLNEAFVVKVVIEGAEDVAAFQFDLIYRPSIVQVTEATLGDFLGSTGRSVMPIGPTVDNQQGRMSLGAISFGDATGPSGTGVLATITCVARGEGISVLQLQNVQVLDSQADAQSVTVENGQVEVRGAATPTALATPAAAPTATPRPTSTPPRPITSTPTAIAPLSPTPTVIRVPLPSPMPSPTSLPYETPTSAPPPSPTPSTSTAVAEIGPTETSTPPTEASETPIPVTQTPTLRAEPQGEASSLPSPTSIPSVTPIPSPTLPATLTTPSATLRTSPTAEGPWNWIVLVGLLTGLGLIILAMLVLRVRH